MSPTPQLTTEALLSVAKTYISIFGDLSADAIINIQSEDFVHEWAPASVNPPPRRNRDEFAAHLLGLREVLRGFPVYAKQIWPNPTLNQVIIWADSKTDFHESVRDSGATDTEWEYKGEYMFVLSLNEEGKLKHVLEFVDSKGTETLRSLMARARKNRGKFHEAGGKYF